MIELICKVLSLVLDIISKLVPIIISGCVAYCGFKYNNNLKNSRALEVRQIKEQYYHKLLECCIKHFSYAQFGKEIINQSEEAAKYNMEFCIETSRLALYASKEIILYFGECQKAKKSLNIPHLISLIQKDLEANKEVLEILNESELKELPIMVPNKVLVTIDAKKKVIEKENK